MVRTCALPQCRPNSNGSKQDGPPLSFHKLPKDKILRRKWEEALNRTGWKAIKKIQTKRLEKFTFVGVNAESMDEEVTETEVVNPFEIMKEEGNEESLYDDNGEDNFINIKCEPEAMNISNVEDEVDPLEEKAIVKQEVQETVGESCLTDYVIPEEEDIDEVKQEGEVIIDGGVGVEVQETVGESCLTDYVIPEEEDIDEVKQEGEVIIDGGVGVEVQETVGESRLTDYVIPEEEDIDEVKQEGEVIIDGGVGVEVQETVGESCLTDYVIPEEEDIDEVKQEGEVIIDGGVGVDESDEEDIKPKDYKCKYCEQTFSDAQQVDAHQCTHCNCNNVMQTGLLCSSKFCSAQFLMKHMAESHKDTLVPTNALTCEICQKKCKSASTLKSHTLFHKVERTLECKKCATKVNWETFLCRTCDQITMSQPIDFDISGNNTALKSGKTVSIDPTPSTSTSMTTYDNNRALKTGKTVSIDSTPSTSMITCDICSKTFPTSSLLLKHQLEHKIEKEFLCTSCGKLIRLCGTLEQFNKFFNGEVKMCSICKTMVNRCSGVLRENFILVNNVPQMEHQFVCAQCNLSTSVVSFETLQRMQMFKPILPKPPSRVESSDQTSTRSQTCKNAYILCNANFESFHELHTHKDKIQSFVDCIKCRKLIKWYGSLAALEDLMSDKKRIVCNGCVNSNMMVEHTLECSFCKKLYPWYGNEKQFKNLTGGDNIYICLKCNSSV